MPMVPLTVDAWDPPWKRPYPVTPTLSVEADQESAMLVAVREVALTFVGAVGACVSAQADVDDVICARVEWLPAASKASTANV